MDLAKTFLQNQNLTIKIFNEIEINRSYKEATTKNKVDASSLEEKRSLRN